MAVKSRLARLAKRAPRRKAAGWVIGVQGDDMPDDRRIDYRECIGDLAPLPDDLVVVDGQVMTQAQWAALTGNKILVVYEQESGVGDVTQT